MGGACKPQRCTAMYNEYLKLRVKSGMVIHTFNPRTWEAEAGAFLSVQTSLVYIVGSRLAETT